MTSAYTRSRASGVSNFESFNPGTSPRRPAGNTTAAATSGPAHAPRPASSAPATCENPRRRSACSIAYMPASRVKIVRVGGSIPTDYGGRPGHHRPPGFGMCASEAGTENHDERPTGQNNAMARPITALTEIVDSSMLPVSTYCSRESPEKYRLSPITQSRPGGTSTSNRSGLAGRLEPSSWFRYGSLSATPLMTSRPRESQQTT